MTDWDFAVEVDRLLAAVGLRNSPRAMSEMMHAAATVVRQSRREDPAGLRRWLDDNADALVAQQLLIANVHSQPFPADDLPRVLHDWREAHRTATAADAVAWLKEEHPGLLRAWLLSRVEELIAAAMTDR